MKCKMCGYDSEGIFCANCGAKLITEDTAPYKPIQISDGIENEIKEQNGTVVTYPDNTAEQLVQSNNITETPSDAENGGNEQHSSTDNTANIKPDINITEKIKNISSIVKNVFNFLRKHDFISDIAELIFTIVITILLAKIDMSIGLIIPLWLSTLLNIANNRFLKLGETVSEILFLIFAFFAGIVIIKLGVNIFFILLCLFLIGVTEFLEKKQHMLYGVVSIITSVLCLSLLFQIYNGYMGQRYIKMAKECVYNFNTSYTELLNKVSKKTKWKCDELATFTYAGKGSYDGGVVTVSGDLKTLAKTTGTFISDNSSYKITFNVIKESEYAEPKSIYINYNGSKKEVTDPDDIGGILGAFYLQDLFWGN